MNEQLLTVEQFKAKHWRRQNEILEPHVLAFLAEIKAPVETKRVMRGVANLMGWLDKTLDFEPGAAQIIATVLKRFQIHYPGLALHNGEEFTFAGKTYRRWMWQPQGSAAAEAAEAERKRRELEELS